MPDTPPIDIAASMRRHIAQKLATTTADLPEPSEALRQQIANAVSAASNMPEPIRQRMLDEVARLHECEAYGHHLIPDTDDLFVCVICTKRFRLVD